MTNEIKKIYYVQKCCKSNNSNSSLKAYKPCMYLKKKREHNKANNNFKIILNFRKRSFSRNWYRGRSPFRHKYRCERILDQCTISTMSYK